MLFGIVFGLAIVGFLLGRFVFVPMFGTMPDNMGWRAAEDRFKRCPQTTPVTNCVSSTDPTDTTTYIAPIPFSGSVEEAHTELIRIINAMPRSEIITNDDTYIHAVFRSLAFNFPDDTEFYIDAENSMIQVRSASRLGMGDGGINRNRVNSIKEQFQG